MRRTSDEIVWDNVLEKIYGLQNFGAAPELKDFDQFDAADLRPAHIKEIKVLLARHKKMFQREIISLDKIERNLPALEKVVRENERKIKAELDL
jgi:hypothetical protein